LNQRRGELLDEPAANLSGVEIDQVLDLGQAKVVLQQHGVDEPQGAGQGRRGVGVLDAPGVHRGVDTAVNLYRDVAGRRTLERVKADRGVGLGQVEQNCRPLDNVVGGVVKHGLVQRAVGIDQTEALAAFQVLPHQVFEKF